MRKKPFCNLTGKRFGRLKVIRFAGWRKAWDGWNRSYWLCQCNCGARVTVVQTSLVTGNTKSCGCLQRQHARKQGHNNRTHGMKPSREYNSWTTMKQRCLNKKHHAYKNYGGRGIKICKRWLNSFENFFADMGYRPKNKTLDRKDKNKGYTPENCRWATIKQQLANRRKYKNT